MFQTAVVITDCCNKEQVLLQRKLAEKLRMRSADFGQVITETFEITMMFAVDSDTVLNPVNSKLSG